MNYLSGGKRPSQLRVENCESCTYNGVGRNSHPCNKCFSMSSNCWEQYFIPKSKQGAEKPLLKQPVNDVDLLTMQVDQLTHENAMVIEAHKKLRKEFDELKLLMRPLIQAKEAEDFNKKQQDMYRKMEFDRSRQKYKDRIKNDRTQWGDWYHEEKL